VFVWRFESEGKKYMNDNIQSQKQSARLAVEQWRAIDSNKTMSWNWRIDTLQPKSKLSNDRC